MTEQLIKEVKHIQQCLINKEMTGDAYEEKMQIVKKLEEVNTYLKDALSDGIEFQEDMKLRRLKLDLGLFSCYTSYVKGKYYVERI